MSHEIVDKVKTERSFVMVKPDGVARGLVGQVMTRIEQRGLKIVACKLVAPGRERFDQHYPKDEAWLTRMGERVVGTFEDNGIDVEKELGTKDPKEIGLKTRETLLDFMESGPVMAMIIEGIHSIDMIRKIAGETLPFKAAPGTIRGDFSVDSPAVTNMEGRAIKNIVHASETPEEAANEISLWFTEEEIQNYEIAIEKTAY